MSEPYWVPIGSAPLPPPVDGKWLAVKGGAMVWDSPTFADVAGLQELAYAQITSTVALTNAHTEAAPLDIVTAPAITLDGSTAVVVQFGSPLILIGSGLGWLLVCSLWDTVDLGRVIFYANEVGTQNLQMSTFGMRRFVPSAGSHAFRIRAWLSGGATVGQVQAGTGAAGSQVPAFIRVTRA